MNSSIRALLEILIISMERPLVLLKLAKVLSDLSNFLPTCSSILLILFFFRSEIYLILFKASDLNVTAFTSLLQKRQIIFSSLLIFQRCNLILNSGKHSTFHICSANLVGHRNELWFDVLVPCFTQSIQRGQVSLKIIDFLDLIKYFSANLIEFIKSFFHVCCFF